MNDSLQDISDKICLHLVAQKVASVSEGVCRYRDDQGRKCAAGCLIPDTEYFHEMEMHRVTALNFFAENFTPSELSLIGEYQTVHDLYMPQLHQTHQRTLSDKKAMKGRLRELAVAHDVKIHPKMTEWLNEI